MNSEYCNSCNSAFVICLSVLGVILSFAGFITTLLRVNESFSAGTFVYFALYCAYALYDHTQSRIKLMHEVNRLDEQTDQLESTINALQRQNDNYKTENEQLKLSVQRMERLQKKLSETSNELSILKIESTKQIEVLNTAVTQSKDMLKITQVQLNEHSMQINLQKDIITQSAETTARLQQRLNDATQLVNQAEANLIASNEQISELTHMLENSKKLVTNLILAGDDYKKFNTKFGANLSSLSETSTDLRAHTMLLGKITNSLAKIVPDDKISLVKLAPDAVDQLPRKLTKFQQLVSRATAAQKLIDTNNKLLSGL